MAMLFREVLIQWNGRDFNKTLVNLSSWRLQLAKEHWNPTCLVHTFCGEIMKTICSSEANLKPVIPTCPSLNSCSCILCSVYRLQTRNCQNMAFPLYGNTEFRKRVFTFKFLCSGMQQWSTVHEQNGDKCLLRSQYLRFEVVMVVNMKITVCWKVMSCGLVDVHQWFR
jgi:hypothetical protein